MDARSTALALRLAVLLIAGCTLSGLQFNASPQPAAITPTVRSASSADLANSRPREFAMLPAGEKPSQNYPPFSAQAQGLLASAHPTNVLSSGHLMVAGWQIDLDAQNISPGPIDGVDGPQTRAALAAAQRKFGYALPDPERSERITVQDRHFITYAVTTNDLAQLQPLGKTWLEKSQQTRLDFESILELIAETFHSSQPFIRLLNPQTHWARVAVGDVLTVPNLQPALPSGKAAFLRIKISEKNLQAFDVRTNLLAHFPCSIAQRAEKRPLGKLEIVRLVTQPNYLFNPENFPESEEAQKLGRKLILPPGPNSPVGTVWIGLNLPGYGIHGTPRPEEVGRTESHGCFRLANWNAEILLKLVVLGTPVLVEP